MRGKKIIFGFVIFGVFVYFFTNTFFQEKDKVLCGDKGMISNFNLSGVVPADFCKKVTVENNLKDISIASTTVSAQIVSSSEDMMKGLSGRLSLKKGEGMFFVFNDVGSHGFWMKDMNFPIDIIFIDGNFVITGTENSLATSTYPEIFGEEFVSKYVLEVPAGFALENQVKNGDKISYVK